MPTAFSSCKRILKKTGAGPDPSEVFFSTPPSAERLCRFTTGIYSLVCVIPQWCQDSPHLNWSAAQLFKGSLVDEIPLEVLKV